jgi:uncharacterized membrane protein YcaP (DUF421 family)
LIEVITKHLTPITQTQHLYSAFDNLEVQEIYMLQIDWGSMFTPTINLIEIIIRGTLVYLALFIFFRVLRREAGAIGMADLLVVVLVADATQNAMGSKYESITEGIVLVTTILFWNYTLDWLAYKFPAFNRLVKPNPLLLIINGKLIRRNLQKEMITKEELMSQLRENGVEDIKQVKKCYLEGDGRISVVTDEQKSKKKSDRTGNLSS